MVNDPDEAKNPLELVLDYCVYAPLGFSLEARTLLPRFVDRGRNQIVLAKVVGKFAVRKGTAAAEGVLLQASGPAFAMLRRVGIGAEEHPPRHGEPTPASVVAEGEPAPEAEANHPTPEGVAAGTNGDSGRTEPTYLRAVPPLPADALAIPDYDSLSASQVVPRLESLDADELEAVRVYEQATRGRKTILNKISQLQSS